MKKIIITLLLMLLFNPVFARDYSTFKLDNGQNVIIKKVSNNPTVTIDTWIKTGSINENDKNTGVAHFLEHLFFKGTQKNPSGVMDRLLESKGAITNAGTSKDYTHYYITIPSKDFELALSLHADMLLNPLIPRNELEKERLVVIEEISKNNDSPQRVAFNNMFSTIYGKNIPAHPYHRPVIGTKEVIQSISREEILDFYNKYYTPNNMTTVIVGDVDVDTAHNLVKKYFNQKEPAFKIKPVYPPIRPIHKVTSVQKEMDVNQVYLAMAFSALELKDNKDMYALDLLGTILGTGKSSILNQSLKEQKRLVYSISAYNYPFYNDGLFVVNTAFDYKNYDSVIEEIFYQFDKVKLGKITDEQVQKAKNIIETNTYYERESISNISNEMGYIQTLMGSTASYDNYLSNIKKVTKNDVIRVAKKYLSKDKYVVSSVVPKKEQVAQEDKQKQVEQKQYSAKLIEENLTTKKFLLENNAHLLISKNDVNSIVAIDINFKGSKLLEKTPSTAALTASVAKLGTKKFSNEEFANFLDERGIKLNVSIDNDVFMIQIKTTTNEIDNALLVLDEIINKSVFSSSETEKAKDLMLADLKRIEDSALSIGLDEFKKQAFKSTLYGQNAEFLASHVPSITPEDLKEYYAEIITPKNMVVSVVGNVDERKMVNKMSEIFKANNSPKISFKSQTFNKFSPKSNINKVVIKPDTQSAWVLVGYKTCDLYNKKDIATLKVINAILGEGMSSRLFTNLRDDKGLAYTVGSTTIQDILDGVFVGYIATNNESVEVAKQGLISEMQKLRTEFVSQKELSEAKEKILGNLVLALETNMDLATLNSTIAVSERDINHFEDYKKLIQKISANDILEVANKYFSKPFISVIVKDNK